MFIWWSGHYNCYTKDLVCFARLDCGVHSNWQQAGLVSRELELRPINDMGNDA